MRRFAFGPFVLDELEGTLACDGTPVRVGYKGLLLLQRLLQTHGEAVTKSDLMDAAWPGTAVEESNLSVQIAALRKLTRGAGNSEWIETIPGVGYRFAGPVNVRLVGDPGAAGALTVPRPSVAVLPFSNIGNGDEHQYLADGISEDIITALMRFRWFFVTARNSSFAYKDQAIGVGQIASELKVRYVLQGSVRRCDDRLRVSAQLIDASSGHHIWADHYDSALMSVFGVQDVIAQRVVGAIEPELLKTESLAAMTSRASNPTAWDLVRQGTWHFHKVTREGHHRARELFRRARDLDPELPEACVWLARVSAGLVAYGWSEQADADLREGIDAAREAIRLDERNPYSHYALAITSAYAMAPEQAVLAGERAVEITPSFALGHLVLGMAHLFSGRPLEAIAPLERGLTLSPHDPQNFVWYNLLALAYFFSGDAENAVASALQALKIRPDWRPTLEGLVAFCVALGRIDDARRYRGQMRDLERPSGDALAPFMVKHPQWRNRLADLLREGTVPA
jgi:TolB-like protein/Flp pilus assembly protein TadD